MRGIETLVAKYARLAGLPDVSPHTLRHCFGKQVLDATKDLGLVAQLLGLAPAASPAGRTPGTTAVALGWPPVRLLARGIGACAHGRHDPPTSAATARRGRVPAPEDLRRPGSAPHGRARQADR